ncbi:GNAT family N-acetyltransferase [Microbacterium sp. 2FI]|uniref:GNAT family N-acetyltransferase n=1 Tax=Microbacterium sp. 2FI TaxID=2502193 RepID=UPI0010F824E9|nr:GNAT family N-acetyltransferase [Microbacterium sp. 2FI]
MPEIEVRRVFATESERLRALRLEALADPAAGIAFLETADEARARPAAFWTERAIGAALSDSVAQFIAETARSWVGTATVLIPEADALDYFGRPVVADRALVVAVYVSPAHRGGGVIDALFAAAGAWAASQGCRELALDVHVDNARAQAAYSRLGFRPTGDEVESANGREMVMMRSIAAG